MANIQQNISQVSRLLKTYSPEVSEPPSTKPGKLRAVSSEVEEKVSVPEQLLEYIQKLNFKIKTARSPLEDEIKNKTLHCLTTIENYIERHISKDSEKLDGLKLNNNMRDILKANNPYDVVDYLKRMDRKIEKKLTWEIYHYLIKVLKQDYPSYQIGRIWA